jgi:hypothetical protein
MRRRLKKAVVFVCRGRLADQPGGRIARAFAYEGLARK